jgi:hypothetical protein
VFRVADANTAEGPSLVVSPAHFAFLIIDSRFSLPVTTSLKQSFKFFRMMLFVEYVNG